MTEPVIQIRGLSVAYSDHRAVQDVSVDIPAKQITAIIGPSGCGKTTLLRSMSRLIELIQGVRVWGEVVFEGQNIYDPRMDVTEIRRRIGLLAQRPPSLYPCLSTTTWPMAHAYTGSRSARPWML